MIRILMSGLSSWRKWTLHLGGWLFCLTLFLPGIAGGPSSIQVTVSPNPLTLMAGTTQQFSAVVTGTTKTAVTWNCTGGSITPSGLFSAPSVAGTCMVQATLTSNATKVGVANVSVVAPGIASVEVNPRTLTLPVGGTYTFVGVIYGYGDLTGTWSLSGGSGGSANGGAGTGWASTSFAYQAPLTPGTYTLTYTSQMDRAKASVATITVVVPSIGITPAMVTLPSYRTQQFLASVVGLSNTAVSWTCTGGSVSSSGLYSAPYGAETYQVTATSAQDASLAATATVLVPLVLTALNPSSAYVAPNASCWFSLSSNAVASPSITWTCSGGDLSGTSGSGSTYHAPGSPGVYTLKAASTADPSNAVTATIKVAPPVVVKLTPGNVLLAMGATQSFSAAVTGGLGDTRVTWSCSGGTITSSGLYKAPQQAGRYGVIATSVDNPNANMTANVVVPIQLSVTPASATMVAGASQSFTATALGTDDQTVAWKASVGAIDANGTYTAPNALGVYTVTAISNYDRSTAATASVSVVPGATTVAVRPSGIAIPVGGTQQFLSHIIGTADTGIIWSTNFGSISATGLYTAPGTTGTATITATSVADSSKSASATLTIMPTRAVTAIAISPRIFSLAPAATQTLSGVVTGNANTQVYWEPLSGSDGALSSSGLYTAPEQLRVDSSGLPYSYYQVVQAHPQADYSKSTLAVATLQPAGAINLSINAPARLDLVDGESVTFSATVTGTTDTRVKWSLANGPDSAISVNGAFQAVGPLAGSYPSYADVVVKAASLADPTRMAFLGVRVWRRGSVLISPGSFQNAPTWNDQKVAAGTQTQFVAEVKGGGGVLWTCTEGSITNTGLYTAPSSPLLVSSSLVTATNAIDSSQTAQVGFNLSDVGDVSINPPGVTLGTGGKQTFSATVQGVSHPAVTWSCRMADGSTLGPGSISSKGVYTAPASLGYYEDRRSVLVRATVGTKWADAPVTIQPPLSAGTLSVASSCWTGTTLVATYDATGSVSGGWGTDPYQFWSISGNGTILAAWYDWSYGYPVVRYTANAPGTVTITAHPSNQTGSLSISASTQITAIPDFAGEFVSSAGTLSERFLDFGVKGVIGFDGTTKSYRRLWTGDTLAMDASTLSAQSCIATRFMQWGSAPVWAYTYSANFSVDGLSMTGYQSGTKSSAIVVGVEPAGTVLSTELNHTLWSSAYAVVGGTLAFQAAVGGTSNKSVSWSCSAGSISSAGLYTAPMAPGTYTVTATSVADPTKSCTVKVGVGASATLPVAGVYQGSTTYTYDASIRALNLTLCVDGTMIYGKLNGSPINGTLTGRVFHGWYSQIVDYGGSLAQPIELVFDPQADGSCLINGTFSYYGWFGSGYYQTSAYTYGVTNATCQPNVVDVRVLSAAGLNAGRLLSGSSATLKALVVGSSNANVTWTTTGGTIQANGNSVVFTAPAVNSKNSIFTITATCVVDPTKSDSISVLVDPSVPTMVPPQAIIYTNSTSYSYYPRSTALTATFPTQPSNDAFWSILETTPGAPTIDRSGQVIAGTVLGTFTAVAVSQWSPSAKVTASILVKEGPPIIGSFTANFTALQPGDTVTLAWSGLSVFDTPDPRLTLGITTNGVTQTLDVTGRSSYATALTRSSTFTLTVTSASGLFSTSQVSVQVASTAVISALVANPASIRAGDPVTLVGTFTASSATLYYVDASGYWRAYGAMTSGVPLPIPASHPAVLHRQPQFYLECLDALGNRVSSGSLTIPCAPAILQLTATPSGLLTGSGGSSALSWGIDSAGLAATVILRSRTQGGTETTMSTGAATSWSVQPTATTTYTLLVSTNAGGEAKSVAIRVGDVADLSLAPTQVTLAAGGTATFSATVVAAPGKAGIAWSSSAGTLTASGLSATYVAPLAAGTATITATSVADPTMSAVAAVTIIKPTVTLSITPAVASLTTRGSMRFGYTISSNGSKQVNWSVQEGAAGGAVDALGNYVAPATPGTYHIVVSSQADPAVRSTSTVTVTYPDVQLQITPSTLTLEQGQTYQFGFSCSNGPVIWATSGGTITSAGFLTASAVIGTYTVTATSYFNPAKSAIATVIVGLADAPGILVTPALATVYPGRQLIFSAKVVGLSDTAVAWEVLEAGGGTIGADGAYLASEAFGSYTVRATSRLDSSVMGIAHVTVANLAVAPSALTLFPGATQVFAASLAPGAIGPASWTVSEGEAGGTVTAEGVYTAPMTNGVFHLVASLADGSSTMVPLQVGFITKLVVGFPLQVEQAGTYRITARLTGANQRILSQSKVVFLDAGQVTPELAYSASDIREAIGVDGPWTVADVQVECRDDTTGRYIPSDAAPDMGSVKTYLIRQLQQPWASLTGEFQAAGISTSEGGAPLLGLQVQIGVTLLGAGTYQIGAVLVDTRGCRVAAIAPQPITLPAGNSTLAVVFPGTQIAKSQAAGPYTVSELTIIGPVYQVLNHVGTISGFTWSQFQ
jgi:hypothetical protein